MKFFKGIILIIVALVGYNWITTPTVSQQINSELSGLITNLKSWSNELPIATKKQGETQPDKGSQTDDDIESIVRGKKLSNVYTYKFDNNVPQQTQHIFLQAMDIYNATGIVKITAQEQGDSKNTLTLGVYNKPSQNESNFQELGVGGPEIYSQTGFVNIDYNHGKATLNNAYPPRLSAAIHEVGHALGLNHTENKNSVMYPVDQGITALSEQDINNLRKIYPTE